MKNLEEKLDVHGASTLAKGRADGLYGEKIPDTELSVEELKAAV